MLSFKLESEESLSPFKSHQIDSSPSLDYGIRMINNMIELDYMQIGINGLMFTNSGLDYMSRKHAEYAQLLNGKGIDFGEMTFYFKWIKDAKPSHNTPLKFKKNNMLLKLADDDTSDHGGMKFNKKAPGDIIWPTAPLR